MSATAAGQRWQETAALVDFSGVNNFFWRRSCWFLFRHFRFHRRVDGGICDSSVVAECWESLALVFLSGSSPVPYFWLDTLGLRYWRWCCFIVLLSVQCLQSLLPLVVSEAESPVVGGSSGVCGFPWTSMASAGRLLVWSKWMVASDLLHW